MGMMMHRHMARVNKKASASVPKQEEPKAAETAEATGAVENQPKKRGGRPKKEV